MHLSNAESRVDQRIDVVTSYAAFYVVMNRRLGRFLRGPGPSGRVGRGGHFLWGPGRSGLRRGVGGVRLPIAGWFSGRLARRAVEVFAGMVVGGFAGMAIWEVAVESEEVRGIGDEGC